MPATSQAWVPGAVLSSATANAWFIAKRGIKATATSRTSTSLVADPDLTVPLLANAWYTVEMMVYYTVPSPDFEWSFSTGNGGWTFWYSVLYYNASAALVLESHLHSDGVFAAPANAALSMDGLVNTAGGAGSLAFLWGASSGGSTSMNAYSYINATRVG